jgi:hypothetical protein
MHFYSPSADRMKARRSPSKGANIGISSEMYSRGKGGILGL